MVTSCSLEKLHTKRTNFATSTHFFTNMTLIVLICSRAWFKRIKAMDMKYCTASFFDELKGSWLTMLCFPFASLEWTSAGGEGPKIYRLPRYIFNLSLFFPTLGGLLLWIHAYLSAYLSFYLYFFGEDDPLYQAIVAIGDWRWSDLSWTAESSQSIKSWRFQLSSCSNGIPWMFWRLANKSLHSWMFL